MGWLAQRTAVRTLKMAIKGWGLGCGEFVFKQWLTLGRHLPFLSCLELCTEVWTINMYFLCLIAPYTYRLLYHSCSSWIKYEDNALLDYAMPLC